MKRKISKKNIDENQLNLRFEDKIYIRKNINKLDIRINILISIFLFFISLFFLKLITLGLTGYKNVYITEKPINLNRRTIVDVNNIVIAESIKTYNLYLRSNKINNIENILIKLKIIFPDINYKKLRAKIKNDKTIIVKRNLNNLEYNKVVNLGEPAIELELSESRIYPHKNLFSHLVGQIDTDNYGISGLEFYLDEKIKNKKLIDVPIKTSLDVKVQYIIRDILKKSISTFNAKGGSAILINVNTGKIISAVSLPDFDLNKRISIKSKDLINKNTMGLYEFGSVFKIFTIANALEQNIININTKFNKLPSSVKCGKFEIKEFEYSKDKKNLNTKNILVKSSNIGSIRIAQKVGLKSHREFIRKIGIFDLSKIEISEKSKPKEVKWGKCNTLTSTFGHGINTTLLQLTNAYASLSNGGYLIDNSFLEYSEVNKRRIISQRTSNIITKILRANVDKNNKIKGSGRKADIDGYYVAGKTGTAQKPHRNKAGYSKKTLNTFTAIFPYNTPEFALSILLDEPQGAPKLWGHSRNEAGWNSAYTAGLIIQKIGPILDTKKYSKIKIIAKKNAN